MEGSFGFIALLRAAWQVPLWEYSILLCLVLACFLYSSLEFHFLEDLFSGFRGQPIQLISNHASRLTSEVLPHCKILKQRYRATPWLCSPHLQTAFLRFFGYPPQFNYQRQLYRTPDGGTIALDWLNPICSTGNNKEVSLADIEETCIVVIIPGLTSDSTDVYVKHIAYSLAASGRRVVVANHRGLGGVSITSNHFYNAGWTEDLRRIVHHLHQMYPRAPLLAIGTSIGANILVKYLGEDGDNPILGGAAAICCPWDLVVCDRFICRRMIQKVYNKILTFGLRSYAELHQVALSRIADFDLIRKSRSVRDFDNHCTRVVGQYETVDTYYRKCSSAYYLHSVSIPLFCISSMDDPVCTKEAIPLDECRTNKNIVLALTKHGGHLAFFEGLSARRLWWVGATVEFLEALCSSCLLHVPDGAPLLGSSLTLLPENMMDKFPYVSIFQQSVAAAEEMPTNFSAGLDIINAGDSGSQNNVRPTCEIELHFSNDSETNRVEQDDVINKNPVDATLSSLHSEIEKHYKRSLKLSLRNHSELVLLESLLSKFLEQIKTLRHVMQRESGTLSCSPSVEVSARINHLYGEEGHENVKRKISDAGNSSNIVSFSKRNRSISRHNQRTLWLLAYVAIIGMCPIVGPALFTYGRNRYKNIVTKYWPK